MEIRQINIKTVAKVAKALKELRSKMVFVGGAVISLYADDTAADEIRSTQDIDLTIEVFDATQWNNLQDRLAQLGIYPDPQGHSICSYKYKNIQLDIMSAENSPHGPSNSWYNPGFKFLKEVLVEKETIKILSAPYFLATKFEAYNNRGGDYRTCHDFEDIIYVIDNRINIVIEILEADDLVKTFLKSEMIKILNNPYKEEIITSQLNPFTADERYQLVLDKIEKIIE